MNGLNAVKIWNSTKGSRYTTGNEKTPSYNALRYDDLLAQIGPIFEDYFNDQLLNEQVKDLDYVFDYSRVLRYKKEVEQKKNINDGSTVINLLGQELVTLLGQQLAEKTTKMIDEQLKDYVSNKVFTKVITIDGIEQKKLNEVTHEQFQTILQFVAMNEPVMMVGPAGSGKNVIAEQIAKALGLKFYMSNAVTQEYQITGFVDAMGNYQGTQFYDAWTKGGVFMLDEMDASIPEVLIKLNGAIANGYFDFPKFGMVRAHKDFRIIAAGNTYGTGASLEYVGRNQLDGASLNRFGVVEVSYDERIEEYVAGGNKDIIDFCRAFRTIANENGAHCIVSYRELKRLSKMIDGAKMDVKVALKTCLLKGLEKDTLRQICEGISDSVNYKKFLKEIVNS